MTHQEVLSRALKEAKGYTSLAKRLGCSRQTIYNWEAEGRISPKGQVAIAHKFPHLTSKLFQ